MSAIKPQTAADDLDPAVLDAVVQAFSAAGPGARIYVQGAGGEPLALRAALAAVPHLLNGATVTSSLLPGINGFDYSALHPGARLETFMLPAELREGFIAGRVIALPLPYSEIGGYLAGRDFDLAVVQTTAPDAQGRAGFGPCADFAAPVFARARRRLALVNPHLPDVRRGPRVDLAQAEHVAIVPGPFILGEAEVSEPILEAIAARVAELVPDGASLQTGIGGAPAAVVARLTDRSGLVIRSGMVTPGYQSLAEAGALDPVAEHITGLAHGPEPFLRWAAEHLVFAGTDQTLDVAALAALPRFTAVNSALEIDLFGQVNLEWREGRLFGGLGGAPDFARAARLSEGGRAILAFPATAKSGRISRIVPRLASPTVSLPRDLADTVVTEHGTAALRGLDMGARARSLIALAAPEHRDALARAWREMGPF